LSGRPILATSEKLGHPDRAEKRDRVMTILYC
jgi:hypothetical protein